MSLNLYRQRPEFPIPPRISVLDQANLNSTCQILSKYCITHLHVSKMSTRASCSLPPGIWAQSLSYISAADLFTSCRFGSRVFKTQSDSLLRTVYTAQELILLDNRTFLTFSHCTHDVAYFKSTGQVLVASIQAALDKEVSLEAMRRRKEK
jgi:hypothetical protein